MIYVYEGGSLTTVQDLGRAGQARYGVPPSGPVDIRAHNIANALVGNLEDAALLEITWTGPVLWFQQDSVIAVCGAEFDLWVNTLPVPCWYAVYVRAGSTLRFGERHTGARAYLAVAGGIVVPEYLNSKATYLKGGFGGLEGRAIRPGDWLQTGVVPISEILKRAGGAASPSQRLDYPVDPTIRVVLGPQDDLFPQSEIDAFLNSPYTVTPQSDRMGMRLAGQSLHASQTGIVSDGIITGSIQVPPDGQPIIMLADHQTTGGYPKIATVIQADIPELAQCMPGAKLRFEAISQNEAQDIYRDWAKATISARR